MLEEYIFKFFCKLNMFVYLRILIYSVFFIDLRIKSVFWIFYLFLCVIEYFLFGLNVCCVCVLFICYLLNL